MLKAVHHVEHVAVLLGVGPHWAPVGPAPREGRVIVLVGVECGSFGLSLFVRWSVSGIAPGRSEVRQTQYEQLRFCQVIAATLYR